MTELPSGTVTFLFTDIEGSTRLLQELGRDQYADALATHERLLEAVVHGTGGQVIDTQGDAFFVAFRSAADAVRAATAAQLALIAQRWPDGIELRVRMGIHTGEPVRGESRYVGLGVHRAARICAVAHGGQILVSRTTHDLLDDEGIEASFDDLGEVRLKDLDRPERLYQVTLDGLPRDFPPLRVEHDTPFAGREGELGEAAEAAVASRPWWRRRDKRVALVALVAAAALVLGLAFTVGGLGSSAKQAEAPPHSVVALDPATGAVKDAVPLAFSPTAVAAGGGAIWAANAAGDTVTRVDPRSLRVTKTVGLPIEPELLAFGGDSLWIAEGGGSTFGGVARLVALDPQSNQPGRVVTLPRTAMAGLGRAPAALAVGDGSVWVGNVADPTTYRLDDQTATITARLPKGISPQALAVDPTALWAIEPLDRSISKIDVRSNEVAATISFGSRSPVAVAAGEGAVWVADTLDNLVWRIDPTTSTITRTITVPGGPFALGVGGGRVWVAGRDGTVARIDPATNQVATTNIGLPATGIAVNGESVWVAVR